MTSTPDPNPRSIVRMAPRNFSTRGILPDDLVPPAAFDARSFFVDHYETIAKQLKRHRTLGALVLAFDGSGNLVDHAFREAALDRTRSFVVGRHSRCDVRLPDAIDCLSLRHLAILVRAISLDEARLRVFDLHTPIGFRGENGEMLESIMAEGSLFLQVGPTVVMVLVTNPDDVPSDAYDAYDQIPERVFIEERSGVTPIRELHLARDRRDSGGDTLVLTMGAPLRVTDELVGIDDRPVGYFEVESPGGSMRRAVGESALRRGILIGRYDRCQITKQVHSEGLSRVHLLVTSIDGDIVAVDTCSTNGTKVDGERVRITVLEPGTRCTLSNLQLTWRSA